MKKLILIGIFSVAICSVYSQGQTSFALKGGINLAKLKSGNNNLDSRTSFHLGGLAHIHVSHYFAIQPELLFSGQGTDDNGVKWILNYINVPVLLQYMAGNGLRLQTGPQIGFLTSAKVKSGSTENDIKNNLKGIDFAWVFGASYLTRSGLGLDVRYNLGLNNINDAAGNEINNRVFQAGIFFMLHGLK